MANLSDLVNPNAQTILEYRARLPENASSAPIETFLYDNGEAYQEHRYIVTGPLRTLFVTYADLREAVSDWLENANHIASSPLA